MSCEEYLPKKRIFVAPAMQKWSTLNVWLIHVWPADAAGGEEEPVHEDPGAVVVGVIGQQPVPLVSLLTGAVSGAPRRARLSEAGMNVIKT